MFSSATLAAERNERTRLTVDRADDAAGHLVGAIHLERHSADVEAGGRHIAVAVDGQVAAEGVERAIGIAEVEVVVFVAQEETEISARVAQRSTGQRVHQSRVTSCEVSGLGAVGHLPDANALKANDVGDTGVGEEAVALSAKVKRAGAKRMTDP